MIGRMTDVDGSRTELSVRTVVLGAILRSARAERTVSLDSAGAVGHRTLKTMWTRHRPHRGEYILYGGVAAFACA